MPYERKQGVSMCKHVNTSSLDDSLPPEGSVLSVRTSLCEDRAAGVIKASLMVLFAIIIGSVIIILLVKPELTGVLDNNSEATPASVTVVTFAK